MQADSIAHTSTYTSGPAVPLSQPPDNTSVCIDIHTAMVATDPGEKLLIGRCPVRNWTRSTISSLFLFTSVLRKINITCCHQSYTYKCGLLRLLQVNNTHSNNSNIFINVRGKCHQLTVRPTVLGLPIPFADMHGRCIAGLKSHRMTVMPGIGWTL